MSELIVLGFEQPDKADQVLNKLTRLGKEYLIDLDDAVVAIRDSGGKVRLKQSFSPVALTATTGGLSGAAWGTLVGLLFLNPLAGLAIGGAIGAGSGAVAGSLVDYGIDDGLIRSLAETIPPDSSALFLLVRRVQPEKVLAEFAGEDARVLRSSLSPEQEQKLQTALRAAAAPASGSDASDLTRPA